MDSHLSDAQLFEALLGNSSPRVKAHLASCPECRARLERLRSLTAAFRDSAHTQAERPEAFWTRQRAAAAARSSQPLVRPMTWVAAIAAAVLAAMLLQEPRPSPPVAPAPDPDQALLVSVESALTRQVPQALAPAELLTQEISRNVKPAEPGRQSKGEPQ
jgi:predicted anti-sigma-YlaC factor YlaD